MRALALATDYDRTLATHGRVRNGTLRALRRFKDSGRKLILVTGRELPDLLKVFPEHGIFDRIVAENGALLYDPATRERTALGPEADSRLVHRLRRRGIKPLSVGHTIVATEEPHEREVLEAIHELGLELQVIFNRGSVMILPAGINKETGAAAAIASLGLSSRNVIAIGDGENDHALLSGAALSVAVRNAVRSLREEADWVTRRDEGAGVAEVIADILADEEGVLESRASRHLVTIGRDARRKKVRIRPLASTILVAGPSG